VKKPFVRRLLPDSTQRIRFAIQGLFVALNIWIGLEFYLFVRYWETGGESFYANRPAGVEGWLPIAGLMKLKYWLVTGEIPRVHAAGLFLIVAFLLMSLLFRKSFCSWLCPVGTLSEALWRFGRRTFRRNFALPRWLDIPLRSLKYVLLGLFLYVILPMPAEGIKAFLEGPYGLVADVKMLDFFRYMSITAAVLLGFFLVTSIFVQNFWCRYACPYGALMGLTSMLSPLRIRREPDKCIDCAKCAKACPSQLKVDKLVQIRTAECIGCMECVVMCPAEGALAMSLGKRRPVPGWAIGAGVMAVFLCAYGIGLATGRWHTDLPAWVYSDLIPKARTLSHP
jgi:polyferredoxin